jgi:hypothetical protein
MVAAMEGRSGGQTDATSRGNGRKEYACAGKDYATGGQTDLIELYGNDDVVRVWSDDDQIDSVDSKGKDDVTVNSPDRQPTRLNYMGMMTWFVAMMIKSTWLTQKGKVTSLVRVQTVKPNRLTGFVFVPMTIRWTRLTQKGKITSLWYDNSPDRQTDSIDHCTKHTAVNANTGTCMSFDTFIFISPTKPFESRNTSTSQTWTSETIGPHRCLQTMFCRLARDASILYNTTKEIYPMLI